MKSVLQNYMLILCSIIVSLLFPSVIYCEDKKVEEGMTVSEGMKVSVEYTIRLQDRSVVDTNKGSKPLTYVHGDNQITEKLQKDMEGMKVGESKLVIIDPDDGYGLSNERRVFEISRDSVPETSLKEGSHIRGRNDSGQELLALIKEVKKDTVVLEHIPPLDGKTLYFDLKILDVQKVEVN